jgi:hypothetical protein
MFVSNEFDQLGRQAAVVPDEQADHRVCGRPPALGGAAGIKDPEPAVPGDLGQMRMAEDDPVAPGEARDQPGFPPGSRPRIVHDAEPGLPQLDHRLRRKERPQFRLVDVPVHGVDRRELAQLIEHAQRDEVAGVDDQVGRRELAQAGIRQPPRAARQVRVGEDRDARR